MTDTGKFETILGTVRNHTTEHVNFSHHNLTDEEIITLADAMKDNHSVTKAHFNNNCIGDAGAIALAEMLKTNTTVQELYLNSNYIGDAGATALAEALCVNDTLTVLYLHSNQIGEEGLLAVAGSLQANKGLTQLICRNNTNDDAFKDAFSHTVIDSGHKNIISISPTTAPLRTFVKHNQTTTDILSEKIKDFENCSPVEWFEMAERLPSIRSKKMPPVPQAIARFETFLQTLPSVSLTPELTLADLSAKEGDFTPLDNPLTWQELPQIIAQLNENGERLGADALIKDGKPTALLERMTEYGKVADVFHEKNWLGVTRGELKTVLQAMDRNALEQVPNRFSLTARLPEAAETEYHR